MAKRKEMFSVQAHKKNKIKRSITADLNLDMKNNKIN